MAKTLVFGHKNPDTDTIASAIAASYLLNQLGGDTEAVAQGTPNAETQFALDFFQSLHQELRHQPILKLLS